MHLFYFIAVLRRYEAKEVMKLFILRVYSTIYLGMKLFILRVYNKCHLVMKLFIVYVQYKSPSYQVVRLKGVQYQSLSYEVAFHRVYIESHLSTMYSTTQLVVKR